MYEVTVENHSPFPVATSDGQTIRRGQTWTSGPLGSTYLHSPFFGSAMLLDLGEQHIEGDGPQTWGVLVSYRYLDYVGRYEGGGRLKIVFNELCQATLRGMDLRQVSVTPLLADSADVA